MRTLADLPRSYVNETVRTTVEQNIVLRWVSEADLPALYADSKQLGLASPAREPSSMSRPAPAPTPASSASPPRAAWPASCARASPSRSSEIDEAVRDLRIKISGCFNSCGQHHVADLGFYGISRNMGGYTVPHFQVVLGGQWTNNGGSYGLAIGSIPSKRIPEAVDRITERYLTSARRTRPSTLSSSASARPNARR